MKLITKTVLLVTCYLFLVTQKCSALQNIFGLHLTQPQDIYKAKDIINSSGGDWGWVTLVIRLDQLDPNTWNDFFNNCRKYHLIPIIRLATISENGSWKRPVLSDIDNLANFLNTLNWPTTQRHIVLFNEINHGQEWGGEVELKNFADISIYSYQKFKSLNTNFTIISSPLDLAAPQSPPNFYSASNVYHNIYLYRPEYFDNIDALGSHSYNIHDYIWDLDYLKKLGVKKDYPIYITETGWQHREGESKNNNFYTASTTANLMVNALKEWGKDPRVVAVTPFIYNYPHTPFDHFSWVDINENLYPAYQQVVDMPKSQNSPAQSTKYLATAIHLPLIIFAGNQYSGQIILKNIGESIWGETNFCLQSQTTQNVILDQICTTDRKLVMPGSTETFNFNFKLAAPMDAPSKTFISWENLPSYEISSITSGGSIYRPKFDLKTTLLNFFWQIVR